MFIYITFHFATMNSNNIGAPLIQNNVSAIQFFGNYIAARKMIALMNLPTIAIVIVVALSGGCNMRLSLLSAIAFRSEKERQLLLLQYWKT